MNTIMIKALRKFCDLKLGQVEIMCFTKVNFENGKCVSGIVCINFINKQGLRDCVIMFVPYAIKEEVTIL